MPKVIIGLSGKKRSGKDTVCQIIQSLLDLQVERMAVADTLKEEAVDFLSKDFLAPSRETMLEEIGLDQTKEKYRMFLQWWGTEFRKEICGVPDYWVNLLRERIAKSPSDVIVITDVRFPDEAEMIKSHPISELWRVERPSLEDEQPKDVHPSECALDDYTFDYVIDNTCDLEKLKDAVSLRLFRLLQNAQ